MRPTEGAQNGHIVSVAVIVAVGVNSDGRREVLGLDIDRSDADSDPDRAKRRMGGPARPLQDAGNNCSLER